MARSLRFDQKGYRRETYVCDNSECEMRRRKTLKELNIAKCKIRELEKWNRGEQRDDETTTKSKQHAQDVFNKVMVSRSVDFETIC